MSASHSVLGCSVPKHRTCQCHCTVDAKCPQDHLSLNKWGSDGGIDTQQRVLGGAHQLLLVFSHLGGVRGSGLCLGWRLGDVVGFMTGGSQQGSVGGGLSQERRVAVPHTGREGAFAALCSGQGSGSVCSGVTTVGSCFYRDSSLVLTGEPETLPGQLLAVRGCLFPSQNSHIEILAHTLCTPGILVVESADMAGRRILATEPGVGHRDVDAGSLCMKVSSPETTFQAQELSSVDPSWRHPRSTSVRRSLTWVLWVWPHHWCASKAPDGLGAARLEQQRLRV